MYQEFPPEDEYVSGPEPVAAQQLPLFMGTPEDETEESAPPCSPPRPGRSTGPRTDEGKAKSSMNRLLHGCRSKKAVLPGEDPAEYAATVQNWFDQYQPQHQDETTLVAETALAHWHFQRASRRLEDVESRLPGNAWNWTPEHQQLFNNFTRYKTTAERSLLRWYRELEAYQGRQLQFERATESLRAKIASVELAWIKNRQQTAA